MDKNGEDQFATNDPDSRIMVPGGDGRDFDARYNVQCATDTKNALIVDFEVTNGCNDKGQLHGMAQRAKDIMGVEEITALGDKGYYDGDDLVECERDGITCVVPKPAASGTVHKGVRTDKFAYDADTDTYTCPMKQTLKLTHYTSVDGVKLRTYSNGLACRHCML
jgi:hypothetical protein